MARNRQRAKERKQRQQRDPGLAPVDDVPGELVPAALAGGAPPSDLGTVHHVDLDEHYGHGADADDDPDDDDDVAVAAPLEKRKRGGFRVAAFVRACWAELQRVQWPDRRQVGQATAVVLGFVIVAGAFLGLADVVAQRIVNLIL
ncbi:MAG: preprotein translocase subunit SecE [Solirubrobacteraceae bacterium]|nr:preprotein translocase subunit SecE [Solirubrobacteraceae bacterium]